MVTLPAATFDVSSAALKWIAFIQLSIIFAVSCKKFHAMLLTALDYSSFLALISSYFHIFVYVNV